MKLNQFIPFSRVTALKFLILACLFFLVFSLFYISTYTYKNLFLDVFTERDIRRAFGWFNGDFYLPGPEMYPKGSLPGPFLYFLLLPSFLFGGNIYSQFLIWRITWMALTYTTAFHFTSRICKHKESLFIFVMFLMACIGPSLFTPVLFASNPTFAVMFHILALMALYTWQETDQNKYLYFLGLIIGLGVQVHALVSIHILTAVILFLIKKKKSWKSFLWFTILIFLPCLPYLGFYSLYALENLTLSIKQLHAFQYVLFPSKYWFSSFHTITSFKPYLAGPALLFLLSFLYQIWHKKTFPLPSSSINLLIILTPPILIFCLIGGHWWYLFSIPVMLMILFTKLCDDLMPDDPDKKLSYLILCGILFILPLVTNLQNLWKEFYLEHLVALGLSLVLFYLITSTKTINRQRLGKILILLIISFLHLSNKDYTKNISHYFSSDQTFSSNTFENHWVNYYINSEYHLVKPFLKQIALDTNWQPEILVKRLYIIGTIHRQLSIHAYYSLIQEQFKYTKLPNDSKPEIHGYFVVGHLKQFTDYIKEDWKKYLSHSSYVSSLVQNEIQTEKLLLQNPKLYHQHWLIPYKLTKASIFPESFYNIGQSYYWEEPHWLKTCPSTKNFTHNKYDLYYCMILPGHQQRAGVHITVSRETHKSFLEVSFFGPLLGLKVESTLADGYAYWSDIQISLLCHKQKFIYSIPNTGYNPKSWIDPTALSQSLNSPLKLKIPIDCKKEEIFQIDLSFKHTKRNRFDYSEITPEQKNITWNISEK